LKEKTKKRERGREDDEPSPPIEAKMGLLVLKGTSRKASVCTINIS